MGESLLSQPSLPAGFDTSDAVASSEGVCDLRMSTGGGHTTHRDRHGSGTAADRLLPLLARLRGLRGLLLATTWTMALLGSAA